MSKSSIGIKIANGTYYKVLDEGSRATKKVVLTTVKDKQTSVQIDLYKGNDSQISEAQYIGSLVIENIKPVPKGEPDVELIIGIDKEGNLNASANYRGTHDRQTLSVSMESLSEENTYEVPEFALEDRYRPTNGVSPEETSGLTSETTRQTEIVQAPARRSPVQLVALVFLALVVVAIIVLLIFRFVGSGGSKPPVAHVTQPVTQTQQSTPAASAAPAPAVQAASQPRNGGVNYYIRWGDTLWDLSISFYRTPWLYGKIAKANSIKNPDLIFAHTQIIIPDL